METIDYNSSHSLPIDDLCTINGKIVGVGGDTWLQGNRLLFDPVGKSIQFDSISNKRIFTIQKIGQTLLGGGVDSRLYSSNNADSQWVIHKLPAWGLIKDVIKSNTGYIAVGGKSFKNGYIYEVDSLFSSFKETTLEEELSGIDQSSDGHIIACGYGVIWLKESRKEWRLLDIKGDFFTDVSFIGNQGLCVGSNGAVLTTSDGGINWQQMTKSNQLLGGNTTWNTIEALENYWLVGGREGALARISKDFKTAEEWRVDEQIDILSIEVLNNEVYFGGRKGEFISTPLPE